jgi:hypothetical protein
MRQYEPRWNAEQQAMIDLMEIKGFGIVPDINEEYTLIKVYTPDGNIVPLMFKDDTEYGALRKVFIFVCGDKWSKYA